jgi:hypothetical protein
MVGTEIRKTRPAVIVSKGNVYTTEVQGKRVQRFRNLQRALTRVGTNPRSATMVEIASTTPSHPPSSHYMI